MSTASPRIVVIGGGTGISPVLRGLKDQGCALTAVVTMFDSGGSSGLLREEFGYPPLGDVRQCLMALSDDAEGSAALRQVFQFRFPRTSSLVGHSLGNLVLSALTSLQGVERAIQEAARLVAARGRVVPVSLQRADLCAELADGQVLRGEARIDLRRQTLPPIRRVFLEPAAEASEAAIQAVLEADAVVLGPGDLYTSVLPNLLVAGMPQALARARGVRVLVTNLMTKVGETDGFRASDFARVILEHLGGPHLDWAVVNTTPAPQEVALRYAHEGAAPVVPDLDAVRAYVRGVLATPLADSTTPFRHHPGRVAAAVLKVLSCGRVGAPSITGAAPQGHTTVTA